MRSIWIAASLAVLGLVACGGGGKDDEQRTYMACGNSQACAVMHSDIPADMTCSLPEVPSCSMDGILATCQLDSPPFHFTEYVYDQALLAGVEADCVSHGGVWTPAPRP